MSAHKNYKFSLLKKIGSNKAERYITCEIMKYFITSPMKILKYLIIGFIILRFYGRLSLHSKVTVKTIEFDYKFEFIIVSSNFLRKLKFKYSKI